MKNITVSLGILILLFQASDVTIVFAKQPETKSFLQWCQQKKSMPAVTRHMIDVLTTKAGTSNCQEANRKLIGLT